jgi:hypothetical protein
MTQDEMYQYQIQAGLLRDIAQACEKAAERLQRLVLEAESHEYAPEDANGGRPLSRLPRRGRRAP